MCTVVTSWHPGQPVLVLALRDELVGRAFDDPGPWWPEQPTAVGGRDRVAGGSRCVSDVETGVSALVLNRPQRREAAAGAPSRGVLPLLAVRHGRRWPDRLDLTGMASFALVLADQESVVVWAFDGSRLTETTLSPGVHMVTSGGDEDGKAARHLDAFATADEEHWRDAVTRERPQDDPTALVVTHDIPGRGTYATVFGQVFTSAPGELSLTFSRTPWVTGSWTHA